MHDPVAARPALMTASMLLVPVEMAERGQERPNPLKLLEPTPVMARLPPITFSLGAARVDFVVKA